MWSAASPDRACPPFVVDHKNPPVDDPGRAWPSPLRPRLSARTGYRLGALLRPNPLYRRLAARLERTPWLNRWFTATEKAAKQALFGCRMCGQCALPATGYACPMTCPKQLRNGPCGGVAANGDCEVFPGQRCVWLIAWERADEAGHGADLALLQRPIDQRLTGSSSWVNYWQGRDESLWTVDDGLRLTPTIHRGTP